MQSYAKNKYTYVFVCGLHRSGTSVLGRNIARLTNCTGFSNTGVLENEGQLLQNVYPIGSTYGGAGRFGFDPRAHLTEASDLLTPENVAKLRASWHAHWDKTKTICVEKTPGNLLMTRFLQAAFPNSYFVIIRRHPVPVSIATQRWKVSVTSLHSLFEHWLRCHELFEEDKKHLRHVYELSYEDYIENPERCHHEIATFIGTRVPESTRNGSIRYVTQSYENVSDPAVPEDAMEQTSGAHNQKYFDRWSSLLRNSFSSGYYRYIASKYESRFAMYGYSLTEGLAAAEKVLPNEVEVPGVFGSLYCLAADAVAFWSRSAVRVKWYIKQQLKALLPGAVLTRVRLARQKAGLSKGRAYTVSP